MADNVRPYTREEMEAHPALLDYKRLFATALHYESVASRGVDPAGDIAGASSVPSDADNLARAIAWATEMLHGDQQAGIKMYSLGNGWIGISHTVHDVAIVSTSGPDVGGALMYLSPPGVLRSAKHDAKEASSSAHKLQAARRLTKTPDGIDIIDALEEVVRSGRAIELADLKPNTDVGVTISCAGDGEGADEAVFESAPKLADAIEKAFTSLALNGWPPADPGDAMLVVLHGFLEALRGDAPSKEERSNG